MHEDSVEQMKITESKKEKLEGVFSYRLNQK